MKKMIFSAFALVMFSTISFAGEIEEKKDINKEAFVKCSTTVNGDEISVSCLCSGNECRAKLKKLVDAINAD